MRFKDFLKEQLQQKSYRKLIFAFGGDDGDNGDPDAKFVDCSNVNSLGEIDFSGFNPKKIELGLSIFENHQIKNLVGGPKVVSGTVFINDCNAFNSINGSVEEVYPHTDYPDAIIVERCRSVKSLKDIHKHIKVAKGRVAFDQCPIESNILGLLLIKGVTEISVVNREVSSIMNKHLSGKDVIGCQSDLIDAGYPELAKL